MKLKLKNSMAVECVRVKNDGNSWDNVYSAMLVSGKSVNFLISIQTKYTERRKKQKKQNNNLQVSKQQATVASIKILEFLSPW